MKKKVTVFSHIKRVKLLSESVNVSHLPLEEASAQAELC